MYTTLARTAGGRPKRIAWLALVVFIAAGVFGGPAATLLNATNSFQAPSWREQALIERVTVFRAAPAQPSSDLRSGH